MIAVRGTYQDGQVEIAEKIPTSRKIPVIITFLEDIEDEKKGKLDLNKFSFKKSRELLKDYKGSLSDAVIEERRSYQ